MPGGRRQLNVVAYSLQQNEVQRVASEGMRRFTERLERLESYAVMFRAQRRPTEQDETVGTAAWYAARDPYRHSMVSNA